MDKYFKEAINQAKKGLSEGGIPIGSVIVYNDKILGKGYNRRVQKGSVILHGEMDAFENAGRQPAEIYKQSTIYTTLSPCPMCTGAILLYGIPRVVIGEHKTFTGSEDLLRSKGVEVIVLNDAECIQLMENFIENKPKLWNEDIGKEDT
ncbi:MAG: nucleoside deaminase [Saprospiraceae bacterium]